MPYTFAHIGYILPLKKKWKNYFSTTGLVFGSLAPDYDILFRLTKSRFHLFQFDLASILFIIFPLAFLSAIAFHLFCRDILIAHLPEPFSSRYEKYRGLDLKRLLRKHVAAISFSILLAIFLHLFLDFLCHYFDAFYTQLYVYNKTKSILAGQIGFYSALYLLPVLFSLAGFYLMYRFFRSENITLNSIRFSQEKLLFWMVVFLFSVLLSFIKIYFSKRELNFLIDFVVISFTSSVIISVYVLCAFLQIKSRLQKKKAITWEKS